MAGSFPKKEKAKRAEERLPAAPFLHFPLPLSSLAGLPFSTPSENAGERIKNEGGQALRVLFLRSLPFTPLLRRSSLLTENLEQATYTRVRVITRSVVLLSCHKIIKSQLKCWKITFRMLFRECCMNSHPIKACIYKPLYSANKREEKIIFVFNR